MGANTDTVVAVVVAAAAEMVIVITVAGGAVVVVVDRVVVVVVFDIVGVDTDGKKDSPRDDAEGWPSSKGGRRLLKL